MAIFRIKTDTEGLIKLIRIISIIAPMVIILGGAGVYFTINMIQRDRETFSTAGHLAERLGLEMNNPAALQSLLNRSGFNEHNQHTLQHDTNQVSIYSIQGDRLAFLEAPVAAPRATVRVPIVTDGTRSGSLEIVQSHRFILNQTRPFALMGLAIGMMIFLVARLIILPALKTTLLQLQENQARLLEATRKAEEANLAKSRFLSHMSHEIRTPMNAILGLSELALKTELNPKQSKYLESIHLSGQSLLDIINNILDFSKIEAGAQEMDIVGFRMADLVSRVKSILTIEAQKKALDFRIAIDPNIPEFLLGDPVRLQQALVNLIANAVKFTGQGEIFLEISSQNQPAGNHLLSFRVTDTGVGLSDEQVENLFHPFYQADPLAGRINEGTGLGLAITKNLVELMGGDISVSSEPGKGSVFSFSALFQEKAPQRESLPGRVGDAIPGYEIPGPGEPGKELEGATILLVEDNEINQLVAIQLLQSHGMEVHLANNGKEAVERLTEGATRYDAVLMDLQMPVMDGYEATTRIRANPAFQHLPIIAVTAHALFEERDRCLKIGINAYLTKPLNFSKLYDTLKELITFSPAPGHPAGEGRGNPLHPGNPSGWPDLQGIDVPDALKRMLNDDSFLLNIIKGFGLRFPNILHEIRESLVRENLEEARALVHSLNGAAANISAKGLRSAAWDLEHAIVRNRQEDFENLMKRLETEFEPVITSAMRLAEEESHLEAPASNASGFPL